jgi:hypothetical protein
MAQVQLPKLPETTPEQLEKLIADLKEKVIAGFATYSKKIEQAEVDRLTDAEYLRFIRARKLNLNDAYDMIMNALAWRTEMKPRGSYKITRHLRIICRLVHKGAFQLTGPAARN